MTKKGRTEADIVVHCAQNNVPHCKQHIVLNEMDSIVFRCQDYDQISVSFCVFQIVKRHALHVFLHIGGCGLFFFLFHLLNRVVGTVLRARWTVYDEQTAEDGRFLKSYQNVPMHLKSTHLKFYVPI